MLASLDTITGLIAPHYCIACNAEGAVLCFACTELAGEPIEPRCAGCKKLSAGYKTCTTCRSWLPVYAVYAAVPYEGIYEKLTHAYKIGVKRSAVHPMTQLMCEVEHSIPADALVVAVPTAPRRVRQRGFDHAKLLAEQYAKSNELQRVDVLKRLTNSRQLGSTRKQRMTQLNEAIDVVKPERVAGRTVVLVDDVVTTGASLAACATALKKAGAKRVYAAVFAQPY